MLRLDYFSVEPLTVYLWLAPHLHMNNIYHFYLEIFHFSPTSRSCLMAAVSAVEPALLTPQAEAEAGHSPLHFSVIHQMIYLHISLLMRVGPGLQHGIFLFALLSLSLSLPASCQSQEPARFLSNYLFLIFHPTADWRTDIRSHGINI